MRDLFDPSESAETQRRVLTVGELNESIEQALRVAFPAAVWVRGEVQRLSNRNGNIYFELHGSNGGGTDQLRVSALKWDRDRFGLNRYFDGSDPDLRIRESMEVCLQVRVNYHRKWGMSLMLVGVDTTYTLGQLEAKRRRTLAWLQEQGLLDRNASLPLPQPALRVGLITSNGSAAEKDFLTSLHEGGYAFVVERIDCRMMGDAMTGQVCRALKDLGRAEVDVIVVTRGGGSKADLSWFDHQDICAAIARCPRPVITAIGHEIDQSLADLVAHHHCKTPTAAAEDLNSSVARVEEQLERAAGNVATVVASLLGDSRQHLSRSARALSATVVARVRGEASGLARLREGVSRELRRRLDAETGRLDAVAPRVKRAAVRKLQRESESLTVRIDRLQPERVLVSWSRRNEQLDQSTARLKRRLDTVLMDRSRRLDHLQEKTGLLDPLRLLARGYSLTSGPDGRLLRSVGKIKPGSRLTTRLRDGTITSIMEESNSTKGKQS